MRFFILITLVILQFGLSSQPLSVRLRSTLSDEDYPLHIQADKEKLETYLSSHKEIKIHQSRGDIHFITVEKNLLPEIYRLKFIKRIEDGNIPIHSLMDSSRIFNQIDSVHLGYSPLSQSYTGRNVLVGIIDFGIEWRHPDFKDSSGSRILYLWDQNKDSIPPSGFLYGHLWSKKDFDSGYCNFDPPTNQFGHGSQVSGIAAGNGNVRIQNRGIAFQSKIIHVSLKNNANWISNIQDALDFIFKKADSLNLPCVVNISIGGYDGSHDGRDLSTRNMESFLNKKSRYIVAAAGNAGHIDQHIQMKPTDDTLFTDFKHHPSFNGTYFNFWADTQNTKNLIIGLQADSTWNLLPLSDPYYFPLQTRFLDSLRAFGYYEDSLDILDGLGRNFGRAIFYLILQENTVNFQCFIKNSNPFHLWRFSTSGRGIVDMWVHPNLQTTSAVHTTPLPDTITYPAIRKYILPDKMMSLVSGFQCSEKIMTVANYVNKAGITDIDTIYRYLGGIPGNIASSSSQGPTRDQRIKPDIAASGTQTLSTVDFLTSASFAASPGNRRKLGITGMYSSVGGTSAASPVVAGSVALLMEKYPNLYPDQIRYLVLKTSRKDSFTTAQVNNTYGHGKISGFQLLKYHISYGCRDTGSINYNPLADFEDSSLCIKKIYGCMDTGSINYNHLANVDNGSCIKKIYGCTDTGSINYNPSANTSDGSCIPKVYGCTDTGSINYNPSSNVDNGSCIKKIYGCTDIKATNYNPKANVENGTCIYPTNSLFTPSNSGCIIFPNPTYGKVRIEMSYSEPCELIIYDIQSRVLKFIRFTKSIDLNIVELEPGFYIFKIESKKESIYHKIEKR